MKKGAGRATSVPVNLEVKLIYGFLNLDPFFKDGRPIFNRISDDPINFFCRNLGTNCPNFTTSLDVNIVYSEERKVSSIPNEKGIEFNLNEA